MQIRLHSLVRAMKVQIYMLITQTGANKRGTDQSTHSRCLKGITDTDQPAHPWSSAYKNSADQSGVTI